MNDFVVERFGRWLYRQGWAGMTKTDKVDRQLVRHGPVATATDRAPHQKKKGEKITTVRQPPSAGRMRKKESNDRILAVAIHSYDHEDLTTIDDVSKTLLSQLEEFFVSYNKQRGKKFRITGTGGPGKALKPLKVGIKHHKAHKDR